MHSKRVFWFAATAAGFICRGVSLAQAPGALKPYVSEDSPALVLMHVRVIDVRAQPPVEDQRIDIEGGKISRVQSAKLKNAFPPNAKVLDLSGKTSFRARGHARASLLYRAGARKDGLPFWIEMIDSGPRLYLASASPLRAPQQHEPYTEPVLEEAHR